MITEGPAAVLHGRRGEREALGRLLDAVRGGQSRVLVVRGEAGGWQDGAIGVRDQLRIGFRIVRAVGVESEMELAFAALQRLCAPMLDRLDRLRPLSGTRRGWRSGCVRGGRRIDFSWGWRC